jgi:hypothetical protein
MQLATSEAPDASRWESHSLHLSPTGSVLTRGGVPEYVHIQRAPLCLILYGSAIATVVLSFTIGREPREGGEAAERLESRCVRP